MSHHTVEDGELHRQVRKGERERERREERERER